VTNGGRPASDRLLSVLAEVAAAAGDGSDLVLGAARAAQACPGRPAWACAGITADGAVAVLVHGPAVATVHVAGGPDVTLTASDPVAPLSRTFAGPAVTVGLAIGNPPPAGPWFWLGDGVVPGAGLAVTIAADTAEPDARTPGAGPAVRRSAPHGVLELDDGTRVALDGDYVIGREPVLDGDVMAGRARPLPVSDPDGTVSRLHLRVSLVGGRVEVRDLGSANGSVLQTPGGRWALAPFESAVIEPGTRIGIGHRSIRYLADRGVLR
jgi:hypothetical protein